MRIFDSVAARIFSRPLFGATSRAEAIPSATEAVDSAKPAHLCGILTGVESVQSTGSRDRGESRDKRDRGRSVKLDRR